MLITVPVTDTTLSAAVTTSADANAIATLNRNDNMSFQIQNLDANTIYAEVYSAARTTHSISIPQNQTFNFSCNPSDLHLIAGTEATNVRVIAESV